MLLYGTLLEFDTNPIHKLKRVQAHCILKLSRLVMDDCLPSQLQDPVGYQKLMCQSVYTVDLQNSSRN